MFSNSVIAFTLIKVKLKAKQRQRMVCVTFSQHHSETLELQQNEIGKS